MAGAMTGAVTVAGGLAGGMTGVVDASAVAGVMYAGAVTGGMAGGMTGIIANDLAADSLCATIRPSGDEHGGVLGSAGDVAGHALHHPGHLASRPNQRRSLERAADLFALVRSAGRSSAVGIVAVRQDHPCRERLCGWLGVGLNGSVLLPIRL